MRPDPLILVAVVLLGGCVGSTSTESSAPPEDLEETRNFSSEYVAMLAGRIPEQGTPCGGVTLGYADGLGDEWALPPWAKSIDLTLESDALVSALPFRLCLIHQDGREEVSRGRPPLDLHVNVISNESVLLVAYPEERSPSPQGPQRISIVATVRGRG